MTQSISDYALIGDCETAALVARDGSIDWLCWPRFDSGACFSALLGTPDHGRWKIAPAGAVSRIERHYRGDTLVLETDFQTEDGTVTLVDFMPIRKERHSSDLVRIVIGRQGKVRMRMDLAFRFDYGRIVPWVEKMQNGQLRAVAGPHAIIVETPVETKGEGLRTVAEFTVEKGEQVPFTLVYDDSHLPPPAVCKADEALEETLDFWSEWSARCAYDGPRRDSVIRSLITVKALTYRPTGGIVAAPTTSLPEKLGGVRNWDYRFCWLRDATFTILSLINAGYRAEAEAWCAWLLRAVAGCANQTQPLYGVAGEHRIDETEIPWLPGYAGSCPVRIGNAAYSQLQVDVFGNVLDALYEAKELGLAIHEASSSLVCELVQHLEGVWRDRDEGIWEIRANRQHFVHSKLMSWVAFDRAIRLAEKHGLEGPVDRWRAVRNEIHAEICERGYDEERGAFTQAYGSKALDAAVLLMPIVGFLPADDPRVVSTTEIIERELSRDGFILRYDTELAEDGLPPGEGAFLACSFWLVDNLILQGREADAWQRFERLLSLANDVGLLAEQYDYENKALIGNFPQAFSHFALIDTAFNLTRKMGSARESKEQRA